MDCEDVIKKALIAYKMEEADIARFFKEARALFKQTKAEAKGAALAPEVLAAAERYAKKEELAVLAKKRAIQLQKAAQFKAVKFCLNNFGGMEAEGLKAMLGGSLFNRQGARLNVDSIGRALEGTYRGGFMNDLVGLGDVYLKLYRRGALDREIAKAMWSIDNPGATYSGPKEAMDIAKVMHKWSERARIDQNMAGAWIGKLPGYIVRQSHDAAKIRGAGAQAWKDFIRDRLDWKRTAEGVFDPRTNAAEAEKFLDAVWLDLASGHHMRVPNENASPLTKSRILGETAAKASKERVLHFRSGGDWFDYNQVFGLKNLREAYEAGLTRAARNTALMRQFGPSPMANLKNMANTLKNVLHKKGDIEGIQRVARMEPYLEREMRLLDGTANLEGNPSLAQAGQFTRNIMSMAKLGGAVISSFSDIATFGSEFAYQGKNMFRSMFDAIWGLRKGRGSQEERHALSCMGVFYDSLSGAVAARFSGNDLPGKSSAMMNLFFRMNCLSWWTDCFKKTAGLTMAHDLALVKKKGWSQLAPERRRVLSLYDIDEGLWDLTRNRNMLAIDGREYFTPEAVEAIPLDEIKAHLKSLGKSATDASAKKWRDDAANKFRAYFRDRVQYAVLEPDVNTQARLFFGTSSGTALGEAARCAMQFKSFPTVFLQRTLAREIYGRGNGEAGLGKNLLSSLAHNFVSYSDGGRSHFGVLLLAMTALGYGSMTVKQLLAGKTPRDWKDPKTWLAAAAQGGGLGIYGDFLFGAKSRMGNSIWTTLAGPTATTIADIYGIYQDARDLNFGKSLAMNSLRTAFNLVPGNNLFWARAALDHMIMYDIYEAINPGYLRRMQQRILKENGQTFWWKPK